MDDLQTMDDKMRQEECFADFYANYNLNPIIEDKPINSYGTEIDFRYRNHPEDLVELELMFSQPIGDTE